MKTKSFLGNTVIQNFGLQMLKGKYVRIGLNDVPNFEPQSPESIDKVTKEALKKHKIEVQKGLKLREAYLAEGDGWNGLDTKSHQDVFTFSEKYGINPRRLFEYAANGVIDKDEMQEASVQAAKNSKDPDDMIKELVSLMKQAPVQKYFEYLHALQKPSFTAPDGKRKQANVVLFPVVDDKGNLLSYRMPRLGDIVSNIAASSSDKSIAIDKDSGNITNIPGYILHEPYANVSSEKWQIYGKKGDQEYVISAHTIKNEQATVPLVDSIKAVDANNPSIIEQSPEKEQRKVESGKTWTGYELGLSRQLESVKFALPKKIDEALKKSGLNETQRRAALHHAIDEQGADQFLAGDKAKKGVGGLKGLFKKEEVVVLPFTPEQEQELTVWAKKSSSEKVSEKIVKINESVGTGEKEIQKTEEKLVTIASDMFDMDHDGTLRMLSRMRGLTPEQWINSASVRTSPNAEVNSQNNLIALVGYYRTLVNKVDSNGSATHTPEAAAGKVYEKMGDMIARGAKSAALNLEYQLSRAKKENEKTAIQTKIEALKSINPETYNTEQAFLSLKDKPETGQLSRQNIQTLLNGGSESALSQFGTFGSYLNTSKEYLNALSESEKDTVTTIVNRLNTSLDLNLDPSSAEYQQLTRTITTLQAGGFIGRAFSHNTKSINGKQVSEETKFLRMLGGGGAEYTLKLGKNGPDLVFNFGATSLLSSPLEGGNVGLHYQIRKGKTVVDVSAGTGMVDVQVARRIGENKELRGEFSTSYGGLFMRMTGSIRWGVDAQKRLQDNIDKRLDFSGVSRVNEMLKVQAVEAENRKSDSQYNAWSSTREALGNFTEGSKEKTLVQQISDTIPQGVSDQQYVEMFVGGLTAINNEISFAATEDKEVTKRRWNEIGGGLALIAGLPVPLVMIGFTKINQIAREYNFPSRMEYGAMRSALLARANTELQRNHTGENTGDWTKETSGKWNVDGKEKVGEYILGQRTTKLDANKNQILNQLGEAGDLEKAVRTETNIFGGLDVKNLPSNLAEMADRADPFNEKNVRKVESDLKNTSIKLTPKNQEYYQLSFSGVTLPSTKEARTRYDVYTDGGVNVRYNTDGTLDLGKGFHGVTTEAIKSGESTRVIVRIASTKDTTTANKPLLEYDMRQQAFGDGNKKKIDYVQAGSKFVKQPSESFENLTKPKGILKENDVKRVFSLEEAKRIADKQNSELANKLKPLDGTMKGEIDKQFEKISLIMRNRKSPAAQDYENHIQNAVIEDLGEGYEANLVNALVKVFGVPDSAYNWDTKEFTSSSTLKLSLKDPVVLSHLQQKLTDLYFYERPVKKENKKKNAPEIADIKRLDGDVTRVKSEMIKDGTNLNKAIKELTGMTNNSEIGTLYDSIYRDAQGSLTGFTESNKAYSKTNDKGTNSVLWSAYSHNLLQGKGSDEQGFAQMVTLAGNEGLFNRKDISDPKVITKLRERFEKETAHTAKQLEQYKPMLQQLHVYGENGLNTGLQYKDSTGVTEQNILEKLQKCQEVEIVNIPFEITGWKNEQVKTTASVLLRYDPAVNETAFVGAYGRCTNFSIGFTPGVLEAGFKVDGAPYLVPGGIGSGHAEDTMSVRAGGFLASQDRKVIGAGYLKCPPQHNSVNIVRTGSTGGKVVVH